MNRNKTAQQRMTGYACVTLGGAPLLETKQDGHQHSTCSIDIAFHESKYNGIKSMDF